MKTWEVRYPSCEIESPHKVASWLSLDKPFLPDSGLRRKIKASENHGFEIINGGKELVTEFWTCYSQHLHRLGSLPLPKRFFTNLLSGFKEGLAEIFLLNHNGEVVGAACNIFVDGFYENVWFATTHTSQKLGSSYFLHAKMIEHAYHLGAEVYSFGRSTKGSGVHQFKRQWDTEDVSLLWIKKGRLIQGRYRLQSLSHIIKRMPYQWVVFLGDKLSRHIY
jgi:lipid II:glycine glycyltransferase (peptidoglycan interpeptide bridge formation enzyme)